MSVTSNHHIFPFLRWFRDGWAPKVSATLRLARRKPGPPWWARQSQPWQQQSVVNGALQRFVFGVEEDMLHGQLHVFQNDLGSLTGLEWTFRSKLQEAQELVVVTCSNCLKQRHARVVHDLKHRAGWRSSWSAKVSSEPSGMKVNSESWPSMVSTFYQTQPLMPMYSECIWTESDQLDLDELRRHFETFLGLRWASRSFNPLYSTDTFSSGSTVFLGPRRSIWSDEPHPKFIVSWSRIQGRATGCSGASKILDPHWCSLLLCGVFAFTIRLFGVCHAILCKLDKVHHKNVNLKANESDDFACSIVVVCCCQECRWCWIARQPGSRGMGHHGTARKSRDHIQKTYGSAWIDWFQLIFPVFFDHFDPNCSIRVRPLANGLYDMPPQGFRRLLSRKFGSVAAPACLKRRRADLRGVRPNPGPTQWILRQRLGVFLWIQMAMVKFPSAGILGKILKVSVTPKWLGILKHETSNFRNSHCLPGFTKASSIIDVGRWASLGTCESGGPQRFRDVLVTGSTNVGFKTRWVIPGWVLVGCLPIKAVMIPSWRNSTFHITKELFRVTYRSYSDIFFAVRLWGELDTEKTGFISLKEIDPKALDPAGSSWIVLLMSWKIKGKSSCYYDVWICMVNSWQFLRSDSFLDVPVFDPEDLRIFCLGGLSRAWRLQAGNCNQTWAMGQFPIAPFDDFPIVQCPN